MNPAIEQTNLGRFLATALRAPRFDQGQPREILGEEPFLKSLCGERKRAERSRKSFLLMRIDAGRVLQADGQQGVETKTWSTLSRCTRETDIIGWYRQTAIFGVIFTEIRTAGREMLPGLVLPRLLEPLRGILGAETVNQLRISFHFFPEERDARNTERLFNEKLYPDLFGRNKSRKHRQFIKRTMDIMGSIVALLLLSPLFALIALVIKFTSPGPIFFKQTRIGQRGTSFRFLKFRSMTTGNDPAIHQEYVRRFINGVAESDRCGFQNVYKIQEDPRITRIGKFLRRTSLDELPQFINVLKGDMSLVGPRPPIPYELEVYQPWHWRRVLEVKPGITGLWQVSGRSRTKFDDMVRMDLRYARKWSLWLDLKIVLQTPRAVLSGDGAY